MKQSRTIGISMFTRQALNCGTLPSVEQLDDNDAVTNGGRMLGGKRAVDDDQHCPESKTPLPVSLSVSISCGFSPAPALKGLVSWPHCRHLACPNRALGSHNGSIRRSTGWTIRTPEHPADLRIRAIHGQRDRFNLFDLRETQAPSDSQTPAILGKFRKK